MARPPGGPRPPCEEASKVHIVNAVANCFTLALRMALDKSNEITIVPVVLNGLHRYGKLEGPWSPATG